MVHAGKILGIFVFLKKHFSFLAVVLSFVFILMVSLTYSSSEDESYQKIVGKKGFFRLAMVEGIWWFITPEGKKFISLGVNHIEPVLLCSENNKDLFVKKYGEDLIWPTGGPNNKGNAAKQWLDDSMQQIKQWGFNSLGMHNPIPQSKMPYVEKFRVAKIDGGVGPNKKYLDPFDPNTENKINQTAQVWSEKFKNNKMILGISFNDMPVWNSSPRKIHEERDKQSAFLKLHHM